MRDGEALQEQARCPEEMAATAGSAGSFHICICICTYMRPAMLERLLKIIRQQYTGGLFTFSVVVVDNDAEQSARETVERCAAEVTFPILYFVETRKNIALTRNKALENSRGEYVALIDDDEFPVSDWLFNHLQTCTKFGASGSLGPVKPHFAYEQPDWAIKGRFFERPSHCTGHRMQWHQTRTGNVLMRRNVIEGSEHVFRPEFDSAGEDVDFFRRMMEHGHVFVWCDAAIVYEEVPASRCTRSYLLKRALLRGSNFSKQGANRFGNLMRSFIAIPVYLAALLVLAVFGQHIVLKYVIKTVDHGSRILSFLGLKLVRGRNI